MEMSQSRSHRKIGKRFNKSSAKESPIAVSIAPSPCTSTYKSPLNWSLRGLTVKSSIETQITLDNAVVSPENKHDDGGDSSDSAYSSKMDHSSSQDDLVISLRNLPGHDTDSKVCRPIDSSVTVHSSAVNNTPSKNLTELIQSIFSQPVKSPENQKLPNKSGDETSCVAEQGSKKRKHLLDMPTNLFDTHITSDSQLGSDYIQARKKQKTCTPSGAEPARLFVSVPAESVKPIKSRRIMASQGGQTQNRDSLSKTMTNDVVYFQGRQQFAHNFVITIENTETSSTVDKHGSVLKQSPNSGHDEKVVETETIKNSGVDAPAGHESLCENKSSSSKLTAEERKIFDRTIDLSEVDSESSRESETPTSNHQVSSKLNAEERKIFDRTIDLSEVEPKASTSKKQKVSHTATNVLETTIDLSKDDSVIMCDDSDSSDIVVVEEKLDCKRVFEFCAPQPSTSSECDVVFVGNKKQKKKKKSQEKKRRSLALMEAHRVALKEAEKIYKLLGNTATGDPQLSSAQSSSAQSSSAQSSSASAPSASVHTSPHRKGKPTRFAPAKDFIPITATAKSSAVRCQTFTPISAQQAHQAFATATSAWNGIRSLGGGSMLGTPFGETGPPECWSSPGGSAFGNNVYNPSTAPRQTTGLRPIIIDGSNVAMSHGSHNHFSSKGLEICINYFVKKGHKVHAFVPLFRRAAHDTLDSHILDKLEKQKTLIFTPSRNIDGYHAVPYDDRYIVQCAAEKGGVIVSKDNYRDLLAENPMYADTIKNRLLMFTWVDDMLMFPQDPLGRRGPSLDVMLRF